MKTPDNFGIENKEQEPKPDLIIDFIRHGKTVYGEALKDKIRELGQNPDTFKLMPSLDESIEDPREQLEGRITAEGAEGLKESAKKLASIIDTENEIVAIIQGTRTRHDQSAEIIEKELIAHGIKVVKRKKYSDLVDVKNGGWYTFVDYILKHQNKSNADLEAFWWEMYHDKSIREDMTSKGYEHLGDITIRTEKQVEFLRRFVRRFNLGKILRVVAVTSDINIEQIQQKEKALEERDQIWVKNADIFEIKIWNDKNDKSVSKEELSKPLE